jgi:predicted transcriptional regulator of viral defense system
MKAAPGVGDGRVLTHNTALDLHDLRDINPAGIHITVARRYRITREIPPAYEVHHRDLPAEDRALVEGLPTVKPRRAILLERPQSAGCASGGIVSFPYAITSNARRENA